MTAELYKTVQTRVWGVEFDVSCRIKLRQTISHPVVRVTRHVLRLTKEHLRMRTPTCGVVSESDIEHERYLILDEHDDHELIDYLVSREEGLHEVDSLRNKLARASLAQCSEDR